MRSSFRALATGALVAGLTAGTIPAAHASVGAKGSVEKFCTKAYEISVFVPESFDDEGLIDAASVLVKEYKKLAKAAPNAELRKAAKAISKYYDRLADSGDPNSASYTDAELDAIIAVTDFNVANCADTVPST